ncbi:hypothetical protein POJ06DRAFT_7897 [Lipomyces tetrasporus]|uniref:ATPase expression protein 2, mitochondrial n=1 Tax=Lipomyces tetrasporus TaxID=54092 RepID=A0AAD7QYP4_9ASCO|nr:uncharacterized protein POJ06DRAFT_7897 [Lipomyces tetrasporus]KAJ8103828.1 hypothetical protein POJ06DRAFT_7897 [Lipomyces tetrasporus]
MRPSTQKILPLVLRFPLFLALSRGRHSFSVRHKSSWSDPSVAIIDSLIRRITNSTSAAKKEVPEDGTTAHRKRQLDRLSASFRKHLHHSPPRSSSGSNSDETSSPIHAHYSSVISVLDDLVMHYRPGLEESQRNTVRVRLPSQKWIALDVDLKACHRSEDFVKLFEYFFIRGKISPSTATQILWDPKFSSKDSVIAMKRIVQNQGHLGGWSELRLIAFANEIGIKLLSIATREMLRTNVSAEKVTEWKALINSTFETSWIRLLDQGSSMSNHALRSMWYLVTKAENQFDVVAPTIYRWRGSIESVSNKNASTKEKVRVSTLVNAVTQMWVMAATTGNMRVMEIAKNFFSGVPEVYNPPMQKFVFQFVDRLVDNRDMRYIPRVVSVLKDGGIASNAAALKKALDIAESMEWRRAKDSGLISLISDFAREERFTLDNKKFGVANDSKRVSDALLLKRVRELVEKNEGKIETKRDLLNTLLQHA